MRASRPPGSGFSTLEMMIAFAVLSTVLTGVVLAHFGVQYWTVTSQTAGEALYKAKSTLEDLRAGGRRDFLSIVATTSTPCSGPLCYSLSTGVIDISSCAKYASTTVSWQVPNYPTTSIALTTLFTSTSTAIALGGDCALMYPAKWDTLGQPTTATLTGDPTGVDALNGTAYVAENTPPYLEAVDASGKVNPYPAQAASDPATALEPLYAIDVARELSTGNVYAYVASAASGFSVINVTSTSSMLFVASTTLSGGSAADNYYTGRNVVYYDKVAYVTTSERNSGPSLHLFNVTDPSAKSLVEYVTTLPAHLNTIYGLAVRRQSYQGALRTLAYIATSKSSYADSGQLQILDVTSPTAVTRITFCPLTGGTGIAIALLGDVVYLGLDTTSTSAAPTLEAFSSSGLLGGNCTPLATALVKSVSSGTDSVRYPYVLQATGPYLFVLTDNSNFNRGELQVWNTGGVSSRIFTWLQSSYPANVVSGSPALIDTDLDGDAKALYVISSGGSGYQLLKFVNQ